MTIFPLNRQHYFIAVCNALWRPLLVFVYDDFVVFLFRIRLLGAKIFLDKYFDRLDFSFNQSTNFHFWGPRKTLFLSSQTAVCSTVGLAHRI
jgi:hypothetical protein